jgi:hypothetical protein
MAGQIIRNEICNLKFNQQLTNSILDQDRHRLSDQQATQTKVLWIEMILKLKEMP